MTVAMTKLLSDAELDKLAEECKVLYQLNIDRVIAQAKLANRIQKQASSTCSKVGLTTPNTMNGDIFRDACEQCAKAILAMEIEP